MQDTIYLPDKNNTNEQFSLPFYISIKNKKGAAGHHVNIVDWVQLAIQDAFQCNTGPPHTGRQGISKWPYSTKRTCVIYSPAFVWARNWHSFKNWTIICTCLQCVGWAPRGETVLSQSSSYPNERTRPLYFVMQFDWDNDWWPHYQTTNISILIGWAQEVYPGDWRSTHALS